MDAFTKTQILHLIDVSSRLRKKQKYERKIILFEWLSASISGYFVVVSFTLYCGLLRDSLLWSGHKVQFLKLSQKLVAVAYM